MTELQKYQLVNSCETAEELQTAVLSLADKKGWIKGKQKKFNAQVMANAAIAFINGDTIANFLTRNWGIRQQALYIKHHEDLQREAIKLLKKKLNGDIT